MSQEGKIIQLKDKDNVKLYPKITQDSIDDGSIGKEKLAETAKAIVIPISATDENSGGFIVYKATSAIASKVEEYYSAFKSGTPIYFTFESGNVTEYVPVLQFSHESRSSSYTISGNNGLDEISLHPYYSTYVSVLEPKFTIQNYTIGGSHIEKDTISTDKLANKSVTKDKLSDDIVKKLDSSTTDANIQQLQTAITTLNGDKTVTGSVDKKVSDAISNLVGSAPDTLNTLQKIAEEMQNPANNTATTVLDQVASKADSSALTEEITRAKAAEQANATNIATNTSSIQSLQNSMLYYEEISDL